MTIELGLHSQQPNTIERFMENTYNRNYRTLTIAGFFVGQRLRLNNCAERARVESDHSLVRPKNIAKSFLVGQDTLVSKPICV